MVVVAPSPLTDAREQVGLAGGEQLQVAPRRPAAPGGRSTSRPAAAVPVRSTGSTCAGADCGGVARASASESPSPAWLRHTTDRAVADVEEVGLSRSGQVGPPDGTGIEVGAEVGRVAQLVGRPKRPRLPRPDADPATLDVDQVREAVAVDVRQVDPRIVEPQRRGAGSARPPPGAHRPSPRFSKQRPRADAGPQRIGHPSPFEIGDPYVGRRRRSTDGDLAETYGTPQPPPSTPR